MIKRNFSEFFLLRTVEVKSLRSTRQNFRKWVLEQEKELLDSITEDAMDGLVVITKIVRILASKKLGREVSQDYAEDLLHRHGWRKLAPRTRHPKSSLEIQEEFKKKLQN